MTRKKDVDGGEVRKRERESFGGEGERGKQKNT